MDIPSLFMIPSAVSSGKVHSVFPNSTDADFDFNRDSDATRVNSEGLIERVGYYGSEQVVNGGFDSNSDWGLGATWSIANGKANYVNTSTTFISQSGMTITSGKQYKVSFTISNCTNTAHMTIYDRSAADLLINNENWVNGTYVRYFTASASEIGITIWGNASGSNFSLDNVSVKEITGDRARLNYEIEGGLVNTKPSLLLEPQRTNFVNSSENANGWAAIDSNITKTDNAIISPDGLNNGTKLESLTTSSANQIVNFGTTSLSGVNVVGKTYTASVYIKPVYSSDVGKEVTFSIQRIAGDFEGLSVIFNIDSADWKRYEMTFTYTGTGAGNQTGSNLKILKASTTIDDVYIWGVMLEEGSYATSYIPTNGSTQTRAAETCNGAGTSSILPSEEGILYAEISALANDGTYRELGMSSGSTTNRVLISYTSTNNQIRLQVRSSDTTSATIYSTGQYNVTEYLKIAARYKTNNFELYVNGTSIGTDTSGASPVGLSEFSLDSGSGTDDFYGKIRDIRVYNTKEMTDSEVDILLTKITS